MQDEIVQCQQLDEPERLVPSMRRFGGLISASALTAPDLANRAAVTLSALRA